MSLIGCTQNCIYQRDGYCTLEQAAANVQAVPNNYCVNFTPLAAQPVVRLEQPKPHEYF